MNATLTVPDADHHVINWISAWADTRNVEWNDAAHTLTAMIRWMLSEPGDELDYDDSEMTPTVDTLDEMVAETINVWTDAHGLSHDDALTRLIAGHDQIMAWVADS
jgi:hypothetical protein